MYDPYSASINPLTGKPRQYSDTRYPDVEHWRDEYIDKAPCLGDVVEAISDDEHVWIVNGSPYGTYAYTIFRLNAYGYVAVCSYANTIREAYNEYNALLD